MLFQYPAKLDNIFKKLIKLKAKPIIVGGFVRDKLLGIDSLDIDIEVYNVASFEKLENILKEFGSTNNVGKSFGVCKLDFDGFKLDFTLPRSDSKISVGHSGFDIKIDASLDFKTASSRRDFTINTIGYDISSKCLLDPYNGINDLKNKVLKVVDTDKFAQDPLRVLRAMQFCARFELYADASLIHICKDMCHKNILAELPQERIFEEFNKLLLKANKPSIGFKFLEQIDAFTFFDELQLDKKDFDFTLKRLDRCEKDIVLLLSILCYKMSYKQKESFILKLTNQKSILRDIDNYHHIINFLKHKDMVLKYNIVKNTNLANLKKLLTALKFETTQDIKSLQPIIHGKDLIEVGFTPSKEFSSLLQLIYEVQLLDF